MKTGNNRNWMVWTIIILVVMNLSTLITILYHQRQSKIIQSDANQSLTQPDNNGAKFSGRFFRDRLNLDNIQMDKFREFNPPFRQKARLINLALAEKRQQMLLEMASSNSDTGKLNALSDSIGLLHGKLKRLTYQYYFDLKGICNAQQQKQLEQLFSEMFTNDGSPGFSGRGGQGWQHGKK